MEIGIREIIERFKIKAESFLKNNTKVFLKDIFDNIHFCYIKTLFSDWIIIQDFEGKRKYEITRIYWPDIKLMEEYKEREEK
jgi:hypothetical protein